MTGQPKFIKCLHTLFPQDKHSNWLIFFTAAWLADYYYYYYYYWKYIFHTYQDLYRYMEHIY